MLETRQELTRAGACVLEKEEEKKRRRKSNEDIDITETEQISKTHKKKLRERKRMSDIRGRRLMDLYTIYMCMC